MRKTDANVIQRGLLMASLLASTMVLFSSACAPQPKEKGVLFGQVSIGPLVPVMREGDTGPTPSPEMYAAREIVVSNARGDKEIQRVQVGANGEYFVELPIGLYTIDINRIGIDTAAGLPAQVEIKPGQTTQLDVDIDTGIR